MKILAAAKHLKTSIETHKPHGWAHNPENHGVLKATIEDLETSMSAFHKEFLMTDAKQMKDRVGAQKFRDELTNFINLKGKVGEVSDQTKDILKMHTVRMRKA